jgi:ATP-dependent Lon protease
MSERLTLPVLPLREVVLFPGVAAPIGAGRPGTLRAIEAALTTTDKLVFAVSQRQNVETVNADVLYTIGTVARIGQMQRGLAGVQLLLQGEYRGIAMHYFEKDGYLAAVVRQAEELSPLAPEDPAFVALHREARARAAELGQKSGLPEEVVQQVLAGVNEPGKFADLVAGYIDIVPAQRQVLLETLSTEDRLRKVLVHIQRQISVLDAQEDIKSRVQEELGERQREMLLREQLKTIRKELGDDDEVGDLEELREKLDKLDLPEVVQKEVDREMGRLERIGRESMESQVIRTFLETVSELPWNERSDEHLDLARAQEILDEDHYALGDVKDRVLEFLAVRQLREQAKARDGGKSDAEPVAGSDEAPTTDDPTPRTKRRRLMRPLRVRPSRPRARSRRRGRSCCSWARRASARRPSPSPSHARWDASTCASRSAARATRPTSAAIGAPTSVPCRDASSPA